MAEVKDITTGHIAGIISNLIIVHTDGAVAQNEICYVKTGDENLLSEVIKIQDKDIYIQCFESTRGLKVGNEVEFSRGLLEIELGPGLLEKIYDGLQNNLQAMDSLFLKRGEYTDALNEGSRWNVKILAKKGDRLRAGDWIAEVQENAIPHKIMVPFKLKGFWEIEEIVESGEYDLRETLATIKNDKGETETLNMVQKWPVKRALKAYSEKIRPYKMLETGVRTIDTLNPMMEGGTGFIPGPFGTGKTVLQNAISKQAKAPL